MEKKNTVLLTVIAIATLLVAVVGATFAYFASDATNSAKATITTTTVEKVDVFKATGDVTLSLSLDNNNMAEGVIGTDISDNKDIVVELTAGSGTAKCTYDLIWTPDESNDTYAPTKDNGVDVEKEYTLDITNAGSFTETNVNKLSEVLANDLPIESTGAKTTVTHNVKATFYNLTANQNVHLGKTYGGTVTVGDVHCTNGANVTYSERTGA